MGGEVHHPPPQQNTTPGIHTPSTLLTTGSHNWNGCAFSWCLTWCLLLGHYNLLHTLFSLCLSLFASSPAYQPPAASQNYHYEPEPVRQAAAAPPPSSGVMYYGQTQTLFFPLTKGLGRFFWKTLNIPTDQTQQFSSLIPNTSAFLYSAQGLKSFLTPH